MSAVRRQDFTIIELLSVFVAMLMPLMGRAVQFDRGRVRDVDRLYWQRQIGIVIQSYERGNNIPSNNGRGYEWTGNPNRGFQRTQHESWVYDNLPHIEHATVLDLHRENTADSSLQKTAALLTVQMPIPGLNCSGKLRNQLLTIAASHEPKNSDPIPKVQRPVYAINSEQANRSPGP
jgi:hypothetical protein